jgi:hypothetical protein
MEKLYKYEMYCGRMGTVQGVFTSTDEDVDSIIGKRVYFGEILGKHSDIHGNVSEDEITMISDNQEVIKIFKEHLHGFGYNPFDYLDENEYTDE